MTGTKTLEVNSFPLVAYGMYVQVPLKVYSRIIYSWSGADRIEIGRDRVQDGSYWVVGINRIFDRGASRPSSGARSALLHRISACRPCEKPHGRGRGFAVE